MELEKLVLEAKKGNDKAYEEIINRFKGFICKLAKETYISGYDTEDLLQIGYTTLIKAIRKFDFSKNNNFTVYVTSAIKNNFYYEIRQKSRYNGAISLNKEIDEGIEFIENIVSDEDIEKDFLLKESIEELHAALKKLEPLERELIEHIYFSNNTMKKFAELKAINYTTCTKLKEKALKKLKNLMLLNNKA
ncbi:sigma-70 family RNA polymerase sigma factor [Clostridium sp. SYSU_GA19001]|uniref:sigma-70 family RNA polymerase sigma factor n=1 Tax=Clostridium caldaquaticum TaxID=2940653 RepID=UPI0020778159|nr:sigma-70 family RNA polymerase sigma factor [Clostridium caldaquaticum]MCM8710698.1 sigma-70 family RNA polymerase sigma factor [Clostridium caldaquaticum]